MNLGDRTDHDEPTTTLVQALHEAAIGTGLRVLPCPELRGASLISDRAAGYVYPAACGGWQIDLWKSDGLNPYQIHHKPNLDAAVTTAIDTICHQPS